MEAFKFVLGEMFAAKREGFAKKIVVDIVAVDEIIVVVNHAELTNNLHGSPEFFLQLADDGGV